MPSCCELVAVYVHIHNSNDLQDNQKSLACAISEVVCFQSVIISDHIISDVDNNSDQADVQSHCYMPFLRGRDFYCTFNQKQQTKNRQTETCTHTHTKSGSANASSSIAAAMNRCNCSWQLLQHKASRNMSAQLHLTVHATTIQQHHNTCWHNDSELQAGLSILNLCEYSIFSNLYIVVGFYQISAPVNLQSGHFSEIWPSPAPAKFLAGFAGFGEWRCSCSTFS